MSEPALEDVDTTHNNIINGIQTSVNQMPEPIDVRPITHETSIESIGAGFTTVVGVVGKSMEGIIEPEDFSQSSVSSSNFGYAMEQERKRMKGE